MLQSILEGTKAFFHAIPFSGATWVVLVLLVFFAWLFAKGNNDPKSPIKWEHLLIDSDTDRASPFKVGYLIGLIVGTWIVINFADNGKLTYDIFGMWLSYLLGGAGWNQYMKSKSSTSARFDYDMDLGGDEELSNTNGRIRRGRQIQSQTTGGDQVNVDSSGKIQ